MKLRERMGLKNKWNISELRNNSKRLKHAKKKSPKERTEMGRGETRKKYLEECLKLPYLMKI